MKINDSSVNVISQYKYNANAVVINAKMKDIELIKSYENVKNVNISFTYERPESPITYDDKIGTGSNIVNAEGIPYTGEGLMKSIEY